MVPDLARDILVPLHRLALLLPNQPSDLCRQRLLLAPEFIHRPRLLAPQVLAFLDGRHKERADLRRSAPHRLQLHPHVLRVVGADHACAFVQWKPPHSPKTMSSAAWSRASSVKGPMSGFRCRIPSTQAATMRS